MGLSIATIVSEPLDNNTYLISDQPSKLAAVIDPSFDVDAIIELVTANDLTVKYILNTHAHFDHIAGVTSLLSRLDGSVAVALHPDDLALWQHAGGAHHFGYNIELNLDPTMMLAHGEMIVLGESAIEVRHTPGHSPGHVIFYAAGEQVCFCGDVIFRRSIGRTDLPGGSHEQLLESIRSQVLSLPGETRLLSGHGPETTVANEVRDNPYLM